MAEVWIMGELLVEIMRPRVGVSLGTCGEFLGPFPSGAPGIFIDTVARLGHGAGIVSGVGDEAFGRCILDRLNADGVDCSLVASYPGKSTGCAFVTYNADGSRDFIFHWDGTPAVMAPRPSAQRLNNAKYFHIMGCSLLPNEGFRQVVLDTMSELKSTGTRISFDPNIRFESLGADTILRLLDPVLEVCSVIFPGASEAMFLTGERSPEKAARALLQRPSMEIVVLKHGARGCAVYTGDRVVEVPAYKIVEVDPTGAGDCFDAGFICGLLEGLDLEGCARLAAAAGALGASSFGPMEGRISKAAVAEIMSKGSA